MKKRVPRRWTMGVRARLLLLIGLLGVGSAGFLAIVLATSHERVEDSDYAGVIAMKDLVADVLPPPAYAIETYLMANLLMETDDPAEVARLLARVEALRGQYEERHAYWNVNLAAGPLREALLTRSASPARQMFALVTDRLAPAVRARDREAARAIVRGPLREQYEAHRLGVDQVVGGANAEALRLIDAAAAAIRNRSRYLSGLGLLMVGAGVVMGLLIVRRISRGLRRTCGALEAASSRDLTVRIAVDTDDEFATIAEAVNAMTEQMGGALNEVKRLADDLAEASQDLSGNAEQIASSAQEQATNLEETSATLEQVTGTIKSSADQAQRARAVADQARAVAEDGGRVVGAAVDAMGEMRLASTRIADIITAIDEIALQTNLLALNAAVEAARAGEQGRGFAVVAAEVRSLAQRSAIAAKEIKGLIKDSVLKMESGTQLVDRSGAALRAIVGSVQQVSGLVSEIASGSRDQALGVDQVNRSVAQMDQLTQTNAAGAEELSATASGLATQAADLRALVSRFVVTDTGAGREERRSVRPPPPIAAGRAPARPAHSTSPRPQIWRPPHGASGLNGAAQGGDDEAGGFEPV
jgi:methyl-accepting chemotaxis protein